MNKVVEEGTGKRAMLDGIKSAGKTGTTNAYRDAWFVGYTGNFVCGVWFGNDDYSPTNRMTGGSLPAMTWHDSHGLCPSGRRAARTLPGLAAEHCAAVARRWSTTKARRAAAGVLTATRRHVLVRVERLMDEASRALAAPAAPPAPELGGSRTRRAASDGPSRPPTRRLPTVGTRSRERLIRGTGLATVRVMRDHVTVESDRCRAVCLFGIIVSRWLARGRRSASARRGLR